MASGGDIPWKAVSAAPVKAEYRANLGRALQCAAKHSLLIGALWVSIASSVEALEASQDHILRKVNVYSDSKTRLHDPRHPPLSADYRKLLAPIGLLATNSPVTVSLADREKIGTAEARTFSTAFLISPCIALTSFHSVFGQPLDGKTPDSLSHDFSVSITFGGGVKATGQPVAWGTYYEDRNADWAAVKVTPCIGETLGWLRIAPYLFSGTGASLSTYGFPTDALELVREQSIQGNSPEIYEVPAGRSPIRSTLIGQDGCTMRRFIANGPSAIWETNCASRDGTSGAPVGYFADGYFNVEAIMFGSSTFTSSPGVVRETDVTTDLNVAVDFWGGVAANALLVRLLTEELKAHPLNHAFVQGGPNPPPPKTIFQ